LWNSKSEELWEAVVKRSDSKKQTTTKQKEEKRKCSATETAAVQALRLGDVKKALRTLCSAPIAPKGEATFQALKDLHPVGAPPCHVPAYPAPRFDIQTVQDAISSFSPGAAGGLFGYTPFHIRQCFLAETFSFQRQLTNAVNQFADGKAPRFLQPFLAGGVSIALSKPGASMAVRPLCCGDPLRRLVAKCFCIAGKISIASTFKGKNYGVGCPGGVEVVAHSLRDVLKRHGGSDLALLKIDFKNAFNQIDRDAFVKTTCSTLPGLSRWTEWCYSQPSILLYDHQHVMYSSCGVQQGDPLGPLYFCFGLAPLVSIIQSLDPVYNKWYMDDGGIVASVEKVQL
jgi:hypothetical protein